MKKLVLVLSMISCVTFCASAQEEYRKKVMFGLKVGANYSNVYDAQGEKFTADSKFGLAAGGFLALPIGKYLGIQPEVLYSQRGFKATGVLLGSSYELTRTTNYIDVPLFITLKPFEVLTLMAGPQFSFLLSQKDEITSSNSSTQQMQEFSNDNLRKNTMCLVGGFDINLSNIVLGARAGWDFQNNNGDGTTTTPRYKNAWVQATVGYRF